MHKYTLAMQIYTKNIENKTFLQKFSTFALMKKLGDKTIKLQK